MKIQLAELLIDYADNTAELITDYSGRGMVGEMTAAVTFESRQDMIDAMLGAAYESGKDEDDVSLDELRALRTDSMGLGMVTY